MNGVLPLILSVETASSCCSVALTRGFAGSGGMAGEEDGQTLASLSLNSGVTHSRRLLSAIDWLLAETETVLSQCDALAVSIGPGSFTGLRIGLSTVKGLAMALQKPMLGVSTLVVLASRCPPSQLICAALDARKKEVYAGFYRGVVQGIPRKIGEIVAIAPQQLAEEIVTNVAEPVIFVGDAVRVYGQLWQERLGDRFVRAPLPLHSPCAASLGLLAGQLYIQNQFLDLASCAPVYVRASDAELHLGRALRENTE